MRRFGTRAAGRFVFLEGAAATGKSSVCAELKKRGHVVKFEGFVELCATVPRYDPSGVILSVKWVNAMLDFMEQRANDDATVFLDRSFLTPWIYARGDIDVRYTLGAMRELREAFDIRLILCEASRETIKSRLQARFDASSPEQQAIRRALGELDDAYIASVDSRYQRLKRDGWFDASLRTDVGDGVDGTVDRLLALSSQTAICTSPLDPPDEQQRKPTV